MEGPPPPPPPPPPTFVVTRAPPEGKVGTLTEQISNSSSALHAASSLTYETLDSSSSVTFQDKPQHGLVGLGNQGATCYMNSLLQTLRMCPEIMSRIYEWKYDEATDGKPEECIPYQLQRLFTRLQLSVAPFVSTKDLTKSFGWTEQHAFQQHDVQELLRVLIEALEKSHSRGQWTLPTTGSPLPPSLIEHLFRGTMEDYLQCKECENARSRLDYYYDVQLAVKGFDSIQSSLAAYTQPELLCGDNQYFCDNCNKKVDALKGLRFREFPYYLVLQLKRFDYDWSTLQRIKLNNRVSFPITLDMSPFLYTSSSESPSPSSTDSSKYMYQLCSVLIASGGAMGGHYFAYIYSFERKKWYNFNDTTVTEIDEKEIEKMYGGDEATNSNNPTTNASASTASSSSSTSSTGSGAATQGSSAAKRKPSGFGVNAYMLLYRLIDKDRNVDAVSEELIPAAIKEEVLKDNAEYLEAKEKWKQRIESYALKILYKDSFHILSIHKNKSLNDLTRMAYETLITDTAALPFECVRLRDYNAVEKTLGKTYTGNESKSLGELGFHQNKTLILETRAVNEEFPAETDIKLQIIRAYEENGEYKEQQAVEVSIPVDATVKALKELLSNKYNIPLHELCLIKVNNLKTDVLSEDEQVLLKSPLNITDGSVLHIEACADPTKSIVVKQIELSQYLIDISINLSGLGTAEEQKELTMDKRAPMQLLKQKVAEMIGLPLNAFKLCKNLFKLEYKNMNKTLEEEGLFDGCAVLVEKGTPLAANEFQIKFYQYNLHSTLEAWTLVSSCVLSGDTKIADIRATLAAQLKVSTDLVRLRDKSGSKPGKLLLDHKTLKESFQLYDGKDVTVQLLSSASEIASSLSEDSLILEVQRWSPSTWELSPKEELFVHKQCNTQELRLLLSQRYNIEFDNLAVVKPRAFQLKDLSYIPLLPFESADFVLKAADGDLLLFKDSSEPEKVPLEELREKHQHQQPASQSKEPVHIPEPSIVIHTKWDANPSSAPKEVV